MNQELDFEHWVRQNIKCCCCEGPMTDSEHINIAQLNRKANWEQFIAQNVAYKNWIPKAQGITCDKCYDNKETKVKYAVTWSNEQTDIKYINIEELETVNEILYAISIFSGFAIDSNLPIEKMIEITKQYKLSPFHWMHEHSSIIRPIIEKWLKADLKENPLDEMEFKIMQWYVFQWIRGLENVQPELEHFLPENYEKNILNFDTNQQQEFSTYVVNLLHYGIDPL
jgi:hypothetical protein